MANNRGKDPSPFRSGVLHGFLSVVAFAGALAFAGTVVHYSGNPDEAGPRIVVSLFSGEDGAPANLKNRFESPKLFAAQTAKADEDTAEPSLGVDDPSGEQPTSVTVADNQPAQNGILINGKRVLPGQSFRQVEQGSAVGKVELVSQSPTEVEPASLTQTINKNARPFENPENKPIVALVIGGLGTSYRQSQIAIDDLPEDVTLSFVPDASADLLRKARRQGHEILAELPLEAHSTGRTRPHQNTLTVSATKSENAYRLRSTLRNKPNIYGVISYNGSRFANDGHAVSAVAADLADRGLAFIQHANLNRSIFETYATGLDMDFAAASVNIDTRADAGDIERALLQLESAAIENGAAIGTGFTFPVTVDVVRDWAARLEDKGILLAPVSAIAEARQDLIQTTQLTTDDQPAQN